MLVVVVVVLVLVSGGLFLIKQERRTPLDEALSMVPAGSLRIGFTDWAQVRARLHPTRLGTRAGEADFMSKAFDADLSAASSIDDSAAVLQVKYGFSPGTATWEAYAQSRAGATMVLRMPDSADLDEVADHLSDLGYETPSSSGGVWRGGADLISSIDSSISPELQYLVLDRKRHLVISSDTAAYAASTAKVAAGDAKSLAGSHLAGLAGRVRTDAAAFLWRGGFACQDLSMAQAANSDRDDGDRLVRAAGGIDPLDGLVMGVGTHSRLTVALGFENSRQARANLRPRATLFVGPSPGRGGSYADSFRLTRSRSDGDAVLLDLAAKPDQDFRLSELSSGPVLFATC